MKSFILIFLPAVLFGAQLTWDSIEVKTMRNNERFYKLFPVLDKGLTYIFWVTTISFNQLSLLHFQTRFKNKTFTTPYILGNDHVATNIDFGYSVKVSQDGNHILVAYRGQLYNQSETHNKTAANGLPNIRFVESTNGGKTWTQPIWILETKVCLKKSVNFPSMAFEEDTGRVSIAFTFMFKSETEPGLAVKEPGSTKFILKTMTHDIHKAYFINLAITRDKAKSKQYLHIVWITSNGYIYHTKSADNGRTWTPSKFIAKFDGYSKSNGIFVSDYRAFESGLFIQYDSEQDIRMLYTQNHGDLWMSTKVGSSYEPYHHICVCGYNGTGKIFSMSIKANSRNGFIRYQQPYQRFFTNAEYPFRTVGEYVYYTISCGYDRKGNYGIAAVITEQSSVKVHMAFGSIIETN